MQRVFGGARELKAGGEAQLRPSSVRSVWNCVSSMPSARTAAPARASTRARKARRTARQLKGTLQRSGRRRSRRRPASHCPRRAGRCPPSGPRATAGRQIGVAKRVGLGLTLCAKDGTGGVEQAATGLEQGPKRVHQFSLRLGQGTDVVGPAQPAHVGVTAHDAGGAAGRVEQDGVEGPAVHHVAVWRASAALELGAQAQAQQVLLHALQALAVGVEGQQVELLQLQQMGGLAARGGTGVQHAGAGRRAWASQCAANWAAASCTETSPAAKPGRSCTGWGRSSTMACGTSGPTRRAAMPMGQRVEVGAGAGAAGVDAQHHGRRAVVGGEDVLPLGRPVALDGFEPPQRVVEGAERVAPGGGAQRLALPQEASQHGIDEACETGARWRLARPGRPGCARRRGVVGVPQQSEGGEQQRINAAAVPWGRAAGAGPGRARRRSAVKLSAWVPGRSSEDAAEGVGEEWPSRTAWTQSAA